MEKESLLIGEKITLKLCCVSILAVEKLVFGKKGINTIPLVAKIMAIDFWDSKGIILIDYLSKGKTITRQYYADLLDY